MKRRLLLVSGVVAVLLTVLVIAVPVAAKGFEHGIAINYEGETYYFQGIEVSPGVWDVPGHYWVQAGPKHLRGKHYNEGPVPNFWSSTADDGELLYVVDAIIDDIDLSPEQEDFYKARGYVHRHELVDTDGAPVEHLRVYLKHTARTSFVFDGVPAQANNNIHSVTPGVDYEFMPNW